MSNPSSLQQRQHTWMVLVGLWLLLAQWGHAAWAQSLPLAAEQGRVELGTGQLAYLRDPTATLGVTEARAAHAAGQFTRIPGNLGLGFTKDAVWLAFELKRDSAAPDKWVLQIEPTTLDLVELYQIDAGQTLRKVSGDGLPISRRAMMNRAPAFPLTLAEGETLVLLRIKTTSQTTAIPFLWQPEAFELTKDTENLYFGLYFGFMLTVLAYSLLYAISLREKLYYLFPPYFLLQMLFWLGFDGLLALHWLPENPLLVNLLLGGLIAVLSGLGNYLYARLLKVGPEYRLSRGLLALIYLTCFSSLVSLPFGAFGQLMPFLMLATLLGLPVLAPHAWRQMRSDNVEDRIFGVTYLGFGIMIVITIAMNLSFLPANLYTNYSSQAGLIFQAAMLIAGLHFHVRRLNQQKEFAQAQLRDASRDAERERSVRREQEQLLHMIGHEVRTPISIIASAVDSLKLIEQDGLADPAKEQRYQRIHKAIKRMEMLMQLVGSEQQTRLEDAQPLRLERLNFREVCQDSLDLLTDAGDRITFDAPAQCQPIVRGDAGMLGFLLLNLYDNALKYSLGPQAIQASLEEVSRGDAPGLCFTICNPARPLAPGMEKRIFEKFVRLDETRGQPGLGLGLYLARRIAEQHGGRSLPATAPMAGCVSSYGCRPAQERPRENRLCRRQSRLARGNQLPAR